MKGLNRLLKATILLEEHAGSFFFCSKEVQGSPVVEGYLWQRGDLALERGYRESSCVLLLIQWSASRVSGGKLHVLSKLAKGAAMRVPGCPRIAMALLLSKDKGQGAHGIDCGLDGGIVPLNDPWGEEIRMVA